MEKILKVKNIIRPTIFREGNERYVEKWIRMHYHCAIGLAGIAFIVEILGLFIFPHLDIMLMPSKIYIQKYILAPSLFNLIICAIAFFTRMKSRNQWLKACIISLLYVGIVFNAYTVHIQFPSLAIGFCIPILISIIYGSHKITTITFLAAVLSKIFSNLFIVWDTSLATHRIQDMYDLIDFLVSLMALFIAYAIGIVIIFVEQEKEEVNIQAQQENLFLQQKSITDALTGVWNRAALRMAFDNIVEGESDKKYALCMIDMDYFKPVNDTYGHAAGDRYLQELGAILASVPNAFAFRYGGDEFCLLFTDLTTQEVYDSCKNIQDTFAACKVCQEIKVMTLSMGICSYRKGLSPSLFLQMADNALYKAKQNRGSITISGEGS